MSDTRSGDLTDDVGAVAASGASLKVALVGPTHPYKGGVASHTTTLAHELAEAGHEVTLVSWSHLYPSALYPGEQAVPGGSPDVEPFRGRCASSRGPAPTRGCTPAAGCDVDVIVVVHVIPAVVPAHLAVLRAAGAGRTSSPGRGPRSVVIAHNVLPHEGHPGDRRLMAALFSASTPSSSSDEQASVAASPAPPTSRSSTSRRTCRRRPHPALRARRLRRAPALARHRQGLQGGRPPRRRAA